MLPVTRRSRWRPSPVVGRNRLEAIGSPIVGLIPPDMGRAAGDGPFSFRWAVIDLALCGAVRGLEGKAVGGWPAEVEKSL